MYLCKIYSNSSTGREYDVDTRSAYRAAHIYGRCEYGETIEIYSKRDGRLLSAARWTPENGGYYYRCTI